MTETPVDYSANCSKVDSETQPLVPGCSPLEKDRYRICAWHRTIWPCAPVHTVAQERAIQRMKAAAMRYRDDITFLCAVIDGDEEDDSDGCTE